MLSRFHCGNRAKRPLAGLALLAAAMAVMQPVRAGQACPEQPAQVVDVERTLRLATRVRERLERSGASVAFIGRAGIDLREWGLKWSHLGLAWRDHPKGRWFTFHLLNPCGTDKSELMDQSLEDFYKVELFEYDGLLLVPSPAIQARLLKTFFSPLAPTLHHPTYNMISYPYSTRYQNSNQWLLEVTAAALGPEDLIQNRLQAQDWLRENGYEPTRAHIGRLKRIGAQAFSAHVHFDDHTEEESRYGNYLVITVESITRFLERQDRGLVQQRIRAD